jgi:hypothetical protein
MIVCGTAAAAARPPTGWEIGRTRSVVAHPLPQRSRLGHAQEHLAATLTRRPALLKTEARSAQATDTPHRSILRRIAERVSWPLVAILTVQAGFSLTVIISNTGPFADEADYLWQGHLEWAHWLHGYTIPALHDSGTPKIYPALGALADSVGGLAGARILSLCFMLGATVLLYLAASRLFGTRAAVIASALWALSEPVLRLAFATYDPMACFLVALSAWLALQAGARRRSYAFVAASAVTLVLASATAFSFAIMIPAVVAFAFFAWADSMGYRRAFWHAASLLAGVLVPAAVAATVLHLWHDIVGTTVNRAAGTGAGLSSLSRTVWSWDGLMFVLAGVGAVAALASERHWSRKLLLLTLVGAGMLVPIYQAHIGTGWALDKHMSAGTWFLAMAAGYGVGRLTANADWKPLTAGLAAAAFIAYPAINGLWYARNTFHLWPNDTILFARVGPLLKANSRPILTDSADKTGVVLKYLTPQGHQWTRWHDTTLPPPNIGSYGIVILQLNSTINSSQLPRLAVSGSEQNLSSEILTLSTNSQNSSTGGSAIIRDIERSGRFHLQYVIPFTTSSPNALSGLWAVWKRVG